MATLSNFDGTLEFVAPTGGATAFTPIVEATTLKVTIPLFTAISGVTYTGVCHQRLVRGITKSSATAFLSGAALTIKTDSTAYAASAAGIINAYAAGPAVSTATTMDVLLILPISVV
jgi:hypothetical protein